MKNTSKYRKLQPLADDLYLSLYGEPKSHQEWANAFNIKGKIIETILKRNLPL